MKNDGEKIDKVLETSQEILGSNILSKENVPITKTPTDGITIDGDKVIAFIKGVENLGKILGMVNVVGIKDAFVVGKQRDSIEKILEIEKRWSECLRMMRDAMGDELKVWDNGFKTGKQMVALLTEFRAFGKNPQYDESLTKLKELVDLCDRLEKHKQSGLLEIITSMK